MHLVLHKWSDCFLEIWSVDGEYPRHELYDYVLKQEWKDSPQLKIEKKNNKTPQS